MAKVTVTIGRIVHFWIREGDDVVAVPGIVHRVNDDGSVDLTLFTIRGPALATRVPEGSRAGEWSWPPKV